MTRSSWENGGVGKTFIFSDHSFYILCTILLPNGVILKFQGATDGKIGKSKYCNQTISSGSFCNLNVNSRELF